MDNIVKILHYITPLAQLCTIEVQVSEVTSVGLCGCNLKEKLDVFTMERIDIRYALAEVARDKRFVESLQWRSEEIFFAQENLAACVVDGTYTIKTWTWLMKWNTYQGHEFEKTFHYCIIGRSEATWGLLFMSRYCSRKHVGTVCVLKFRSA